MTRARRTWDVAGWAKFWSSGEAASTLDGDMEREKSGVGIKLLMMIGVVENLKESQNRHPPE